MSGATEYDAQGEYAREMRAGMRPRNYSPRVAQAFRENLSTAMKNDPALIAQMNPGYTDRVKNWTALSVEERMAEVVGMNNYDELRAAMIVEEDPNVLSVMVEKVAELKGKQKSVLSSR
jgi:hypothetical protein